MANENANRSHASASFALQNPPIMVVNNGFVAGSLVRQAIGEYTVGLIEKIDPTGGAVFVTVASETPRFVGGHIRPISPSAPNEEIVLTCWDAAGAAADIGEVYIEVRRYPVQS